MEAADRIGRFLVATGSNSEVMWKGKIRLRY